MTMKQLISVLVAAMFAAVSVTAIAQDKAAEKKDKTAHDPGGEEARQEQATATKRPPRRPKARAQEGRRHRSCGEVDRSRRSNPL